jgi:DNA-binding transcriptional LysR family regulator
LARSCSTLRHRAAPFGRIRAVGAHTLNASPDDLARCSGPETPHDLQAHNCLRVRVLSGVFLPWQFLVDEKVVEFEVTGTVITEHPKILIRSALDGIGLLYVEDDFLTPPIAAGRLVPILREWMPPPTGGFLPYYPSRRQKSGAVADVCRFPAREPQGGWSLGKKRGRSLTPSAKRAAE